MNELTTKITQLDELLTKTRKELNSIKENTHFCYKCKNYFLPENAQTTSREETHRKLIYQDCGYGDNDVYADVTDCVVYYVCPECGNLIEKTRFFLNMKNERRRNDD